MTSELRPRRARATMRDVAEIAGVGIKTVSRVVNGEPNVAPATAERILKVIQEVGYQQDLRAGSLRRGNEQSHVVGLMLGAIDNPFSSTVQAVIERRTREEGVLLVTSTLDDDEHRERRTIQLLLRHRVDGIIFATPTHDLGYLREQEDFGVAFAVIDGDGGSLSCDTFNSDNVGGSELAVRHLHSAGHERIAFLSPRDDVSSIAQRKEGFLAETRRLGLRVSDHWLLGNLDKASPERAIRALLNSDDAPTALFTAQNKVALETIHCLRNLGLEQEIALVSFDDFPGADLPTPGLTVIRQDITGLATAAADRIFVTKDGGFQVPTSRIFPVELIQRGSGEIPPR